MQSSQHQQAQQVGFRAINVKVSDHNSAAWSYARSSSTSTVSGESVSSASCFGDDSWSDEMPASAGGPHWMTLGIGSFTGVPEHQVVAVQAPAKYVATQGRKHWMAASKHVASSPRVAQPTPECRAMLTSQATPFVPKSHWIVHTKNGIVQQPFKSDSTPRSTMIREPVPEDAPVEHQPLEPKEAEGTAACVQTPPQGGGLFGSFFSYIFGASPADDLTAAVANAPAENRVDPLEDSIRSLQSLPAKDLPVKHTFIHYRNEDLDDDSDFEGSSPRRLTIVRSRSAPALLVSVGDASKRAAKVEAHKNGTCKPCAYFHQKEDGCRWGDDCDFCHACEPGEIKKRKRDKVKALKAASRVFSGRSGRTALGRLGA
mmetsp:Transcript_95949/g.240486  ORF Transcript_95949/g.240486 Transcript_95949/m.240486 type:complete len:372 (-) Transcript_95949:185-1300(-)